MDQQLSEMPATLESLRTSRRSLTGAKGQIQVLKLRLVIQGNPAFNKNKYLRGGKGSSNDSL